MSIALQAPVRLHFPGSRIRDIGSERQLPVTFKEVTAPCTVPAEDGQRILNAAHEILAQGEDLLRALPQERYAQHVPSAFNGSIGGHYRHCLDHFTSLLRGFDADEVDYDSRERDRRIETEPERALQLTRETRQSLQRLNYEHLARPVATRCAVSYTERNSPRAGSTYGRELVYAIAHAIHHYALISVMARLLDVTLPARFGVAPSTVAQVAARDSSERA